MGKETQTQNSNCNINADKNSNSKSTNYRKPNNSNGRKPNSKPNSGNKLPNKPKQDWQWYADSDIVKRMMASFPFTEIVGSQLPSANGKDAVPGIVIAEYCPAISATAGQNNYATRAADTYFQYLTQGFTGGVNFEAPDLLMTALAACNVFVALEDFRRAIGVVNYYLQFNKYYAKAIVQALGFDYGDLVNNRAEYVAQFNTRVAQVNKLFAVPKTFNLLNREMFIARYLFTDTKTPEYSTVYGYCPMKLWRYSATSVKTGTSLLLKDFHYQRQDDSVVGGIIDLMQGSEFFALCDDMINALIDDDVRDIFGAVRRVYSDAEFYKMEELDINYVTPILQHDVVALAFHNMCGIAKPFLRGQDSTSLPNDVAIYQDAKGNILDCYWGTIRESAADPKMRSMYTECILDTYDTDTTPDTLLDVTANQQIVDVNTPLTGTNFTFKMWCRCEFITAIAIYTMENDVLHRYETDLMFEQDGTYDWLRGYKLALLSKLDSHPITMSYRKVDNKPEVIRYGELDMYTIVDFKLLARIHVLSQFALLKMPENSKSVAK